MTTPQESPYGSWKSPITADLIVSATIGLGQVVLDAGDVYWTELRPLEGGRNVIVRRTPDGRVEDVIPPPFNARTRVHEYGGGEFTVAKGSAGGGGAEGRALLSDQSVVYFSNFADQHL